jgi:hypothetical protein
METKYIKKSQVSEVISAIPKSAIFTIEFVKVDGSVRVMNCRRGVKAHLNPTPTRQKPVMDEKYVTVYDMKNRGYRHINKETTKSIHAARVHYIVEGE